MTDQQNKSPPSHTPGDWDFDSGFIVAPDPSGKHRDIYIAEIVTEDEEGRLAPEDQQVANGHLLAKAPALLEALERAFEILDGIADKLFYADGQPVTSLDARQIEEVYFEALSEHVAFDMLLRQARREI